MDVWECTCVSRSMLEYCRSLCVCTSMRVCIISEFVGVLCICMCNGLFHIALVHF